MFVVLNFTQLQLLLTTVVIEKRKSIFRLDVFELHRYSKLIGIISENKKLHKDFYRNVI